MPLPTQSDVHVNRPLTNVSVATVQEASNFIAAEVFPVVPVQKDADIYLTYDNAYWDRDEMEVRGDATESAGSGYAIDSSNTYFCLPYAFHKDISDRQRANADAPIDLDREAVKYVTLKALIKREILFAASFMAGSVWTNYDYDGVSGTPSTNEFLQWNDASSTPIEDIWDAKQAILEATGFEPNKLVLGYPVYKNLINHPDIVDRVKYDQTPGSPATVDVAELAAVFKVERVLVSRGVKNTGKEGAASQTRSFINGKAALLCYAAPAPSIMAPSAGYIFAWTGAFGAGPDGQRITRMRMDLKKADRVEIEMAMDLKKVSTSLGAFFDSAVA